MAEVDRVGSSGQVAPGGIAEIDVAIADVASTGVALKCRGAPGVIPVAWAQSPFTTYNDSASFNGQALVAETIRVRVKDMRRKPRGAIAATPVLTIDLP